VEIWVAAAALVVGMVAIGLQVLPKGDVGRDAAGPGDDGTTSTTVADEAAGDDGDGGRGRDEGEPVVDDDAAGPARVSVGGLDVGECFNDSSFRSDGEQAGELTVVDCGESHDGEVFYVADITGDGDYPGDTAIEATASQGCRAAFEGYVGTDPDESRWNFGWYTPSEDSWEVDGHRTMVCFVDDYDLEPIVGSKKDAGD
jgi:hypothetical protein